MSRYSLYLYRGRCLNGSGKFRGAYGDAGSILGNQIVVHGGAVSESLTINPRGVGPLNNKHGDRSVAGRQRRRPAHRASAMCIISLLTLSGWSQPHTALDTRPPRGGVTVGRGQD